MLYVKDLPRMVEFYSGTLGLKPIEETRMDTWVEFEAGESRFSLHAIPAHIAAGIEITSPPKVREKNPLTLIFEVEDAASECDRLESQGVTIIRRPWAFELVDPEGNLCRLYSPERA